MVLFMFYLNLCSGISFIKFIPKYESSECCKWFWNLVSYHPLLSSMYCYMLILYTDFCPSYLLVLVACVCACIQNFLYGLLYYLYRELLFLLLLPSLETLYGDSVCFLLPLIKCLFEVIKETYLPVFLPSFCFLK